ncbi:MAG: hypothetical protein GY863_16235, partial [bacterium]|nr:hypothetical protein [bacterium]
EAFLSHSGISSRIAFSGIISRPENRYMIDLLKIEMSELERINLDSYPVIALTDTQPGTGNNSLPKNRVPDIVIDHHPLTEIAGKVPFLDIREDVGSTSAIVTEYIISSDVKISKRLATALYFGIMTDTRDLSRSSSKIDLQAAIFLYPSVLHKTLGRINNPAFSLNYMKSIVNSLLKAYICEDVMIVDTVGKLASPDMLSQIVDLSIGIKKIKWAIAIGSSGSNVYFSIRSDSKEQMAGIIARLIAGGMGTGGGHDMSAGGRIPVRDMDEDEIREKIKFLFLYELDIDPAGLKSVF